MLKPEFTIRTYKIGNDYYFDLYVQERYFANKRRIFTSSDVYFPTHDEAAKIAKDTLDVILTMEKRRYNPTGEYNLIYEQWWY